MIKEYGRYGDFNYLKIYITAGIYFANLSLIIRIVQFKESYYED